MVGIYVRLSREDEENNSLSHQEREGKEFAKKIDQPYIIYNEGQGISGGAKISDRPELARLMQDITNDEVNIVWFRHQNRLERSSDTFHIFSNLAKKKKLRVVFGANEVDWNNPQNYLQSSIMTAINQYQREVQSYQTKKTLLDNAKEGKAFGINPYGLKVDKGYFVINPDEAEIIRKIFAFSLEGKGTKTIAELLNEEGVPTRYNTIKKGTITTKNKFTSKETTTKKESIKWAGNTVRSIIVNPIYKGIKIWNSSTSSRNKKKLKEGKPVEPEIQIELPQLQIVEPHYWQKVNDHLKENQNNTGKKVDHKYLLKGLLECSECERNFYGRTRTNKKDNYYMCSSKRYKNHTCKNRSINIGVLDSFIWESMFEGNALYNKMVDTFKGGGTDKRRKELEIFLLKIKEDLNKLNNQERNRENALLEGELTTDRSKEIRLRITRSVNDCNERSKRYEEELFELKNETKILDDIAFDWGFLKEESRVNLFKEGKDQLRADLEESLTKKKRKKAFNPSFTEKQRILRKYIKRIHLFYDPEYRIYTISLKYTLPIPDEVYLIDSNYIGAFNTLTKKSVHWFYDYGRHFTLEKVMETNKLLRNYTSLL